MHPFDHRPQGEDPTTGPTAAPTTGPTAGPSPAPTPPAAQYPPADQPHPSTAPRYPATAAPWMAPAAPAQGPAGAQPHAPANPYGYPGPAGPQYPAADPSRGYPAGSSDPSRGYPTGSSDPSRGYPAGAGGAWPVGTVPAPASAPRRDRRWPGIVGAAALAAVLASGGTAALLDGTNGASATPTTLASLDETASDVVPVAGSSTSSPNWEKVAAAVRPSVVAIQVTLQGGSAEGSGVILDTDGHILTNNHVVSGAQGDVTVTLSDGRVFDATVVGTDPTTDLAVIKLTDPPSDLSPAVIGDSDQVAVGEDVMAVGNPLGLSSTVTTGIVSALDRPVSTSDGGSTVVTNAIQIDAAINPGNSGGPLFDGQGKVIGITSSIASLSQSSGSIGLGFAIPSNLADRVAAELLQDGSASHAFLGVSLSDGNATADGVTRLGAVIEQVNAGTPAADAGLKVGDVIVAIDGNPAAGAESLTAYVRELASGETAQLTVVRDGKAFTVDVTFAALTQ